MNGIFLSWMAQLWLQQMPVPGAEAFYNGFNSQSSLEFQSREKAPLRVVARYGGKMNPLKILWTMKQSSLSH
uniref:Uncharacterized protein n=1 Tax=Rhizophora mucronata TaxID=61149 RepID=A0A2P2K1R0_RHIMU